MANHRDNSPQNYGNNYNRKANNPEQRGYYRNNYNNAGNFNRINRNNQSNIRSTQ